MSTLLAAPFVTQQSTPKLPLDIRGRTAAEQDKTKTKGKERKHDAGDILARKRLENIRRHSAHTRHRNGIINAAEKNRLNNTEKQMDKLQKRAANNISRYQHQLRQELYEMEASRRALRHHSVTEVSTETHTDKKGLSKFAAKGRYMYSVRNETKTQKECMESFNSRKEHASTMLKPARRQSVIAMDNGKNMGSAPPDNYHEVGRRLSMARMPSFIESSDDDDSCFMEDIALPSNLGAPDVTQGLLSPPPFDIVKFRSEIGPELQVELDNLEIGNSTGASSNPNYEIPEESTTEGRKVAQLPSATLKLPPVQVSRSLVGGRSPKQQAMSSLVKPGLSTVSEN
ncbi:uncharacterized protein LOC117303631 [Asterias rubens]|uniref:uncharacterized protein LOC117303631 n=1 Tax=Asterias rubens TaxID=7604 RepID=UPI00145587FC|nr:uncharacterized protein LOC117303631 [Asterias rubens]